MIEYAKIILPKVSFSKELFRKELDKCIGWIEKDELQNFYKWCFENFNEKYSDILTESFANIAA